MKAALIALSLGGAAPQVLAHGIHAGVQETSLAHLFAHGAPLLLAGGVLAALGVAVLRRQR